MLLLIHTLALQNDVSGIRDATRQILKTHEEIDRSYQIQSAYAVAPLDLDQSSEQARLWLEWPKVSDHKHQKAYRGCLNRPGTYQDAKRYRPARRSVSNGTHDEIDTRGRLERSPADRP